MKQTIGNIETLMYYTSMSSILSKVQLLSNEQIISPSFGDKDFESRLDEQTPFVNRLRTGCLR